MLTLPRVSDIRDALREAYRTGDNRVNGTIELTGLSFLADEPAIFGKPNEYIERELKWYLSQSRYVDDIPGKTPRIWEEVSSRHGRINSNYGWCVFSDENGGQLHHVVESIADDRNTRQAIAIYTRPSMHADAVDDGMHDFMCTNTVTYQLRRGRVNAIVNMRSNDIVFGYKNDWAWQSWCLDWVVDRLHKVMVDCERGDIIWQVGSMHIYERHWKYLDNDQEDNDEQNG